MSGFEDFLGGFFDRGADIVTSRKQREAEEDALKKRRADELQDYMKKLEIKTEMQKESAAYQQKLEQERLQQFKETLGLKVKEGQSQSEGLGSLYETREKAFALGVPKEILEEIEAKIETKQYYQDEARRPTAGRFSRDVQQNIEDILQEDKTTNISPVLEGVDDLKLVLTEEELKRKGLVDSTGTPLAGVTVTSSDSNPRFKAVSISNKNLDLANPKVKRVLNPIISDSKIRTKNLIKEMQDTNRREVITQDMIATSLRIEQQLNTMEYSGDPVLRKEAYEEAKDLYAGAMKGQDLESSNLMTGRRRKIINSLKPDTSASTDTSTTKSIDPRIIDAYNKIMSMDSTAEAKTKRVQSLLDALAARGVNVTMTDLMGN